MTDSLTTDAFDQDEQAAYYHAHHDQLSTIREKLASVRHRINTYPDAVAKSILLEADMFAVLSVSTAVDAHESAFKQCTSALDGGGDPTLLANIIKNVRGPETNNAVLYHNYKSSFVENLLTNVDYDRQLELFRAEKFDALHEFKREHVDGLGTIKSAFALDMCGDLSRPCIDQQLARTLGFDDRYFNRIIVDTYHERVAEARARTSSELDHLEPFLWQWVTWDYIRESDGLTAHNAWFDRILETPGLTASSE
jgi:hypothetical protein